MEIGIIDADLIGRKKHAFPNLTLMKISGYHKDLGDNVTLKQDYIGLEDFDKVYIAKVFSDTPIPITPFGDPLRMANVEYGGTGFYFDNAPKLRYEVEHHKPDYDLYNFDGKYYREYSIGFLTRGCFRHCPFCVNRRKSMVEAASPLSEFVDEHRPKICLLDDNFFGYAGWKDLLKELQSQGKPFQFKQGLDARLLDEEKASILFSSRYDGDYIFAFDDWQDAELIKEKLKLIRRHYVAKDKVKFYVLCGYDRAGKYDLEFYLRDLREVGYRLKMLKEYDCLGYVMRHEKYKGSDLVKVYNDLTAYANQPPFFTKMSFLEFVRRRSRDIKPIVLELDQILR